MTKSASEFLHSIEISEFSATPKYLQLANSVLSGIKAKRFQKGDLLPSINELSTFFDISRDTVEKAYKHLKLNGIISSTPGKGYFIAVNDVKQGLKIAFLLNKLSEHKKIVYDAFANEMGECAALDLFVYNSDLSYLRSLLPNLTKTYDYYVIFPHFREGSDKAGEVINKYIPTEKLVLLGKIITELKGDFLAVYENHQEDLIQALKKSYPILKKYNKLKLIFPDYSDYPKAIIKGFYQFCQSHQFEYTLIPNLKKEHIEKGTCYINIAERDLVVLLSKVVNKNFVVGKDVGIISYNETALKKFILNGITTISTDFEYMGKAAARLIKEGSKQQVEVPFHVKIRDSI